MLAPVSRIFTVLQKRDRRKIDIAVFSCHTQTALTPSVARVLQHCLLLLSRIEGSC